MRGNRPSPAAKTTPASGGSKNSRTAAPGTTLGTGGAGSRSGKGGIGKAFKKNRKGLQIRHKANNQGAKGIDPSTTPAAADTKRASTPRKKPRLVKTRAALRTGRQYTAAALCAGVAGGVVGAATVFSKKPYGRNVARKTFAWRLKRQAEVNSKRITKAKNRLAEPDVSAARVSDPERAATRVDIHRPGDAAAAFGIKKTTPGNTFAPSTTTSIPRTFARPATGATRMTTFSMHDAASEFAAAAAGYAVDPDQAGAMMQVRTDISLLPEAENQIAEGFRAWVSRLSEGFAIDPAVTDALHRVYQAQLAAAQAATEVVSVFEKVHEDDIAKHENPRAGERGWNV